MTMNKAAQSKLALIMAALGLVILAAVLYLAFIFPKTMAVWMEEGKSLSMAEQIVRRLSVFCQCYGLILLPWLIAGIVACVLWSVMAKSLLQPRCSVPRRIHV